MIRTMYFGYNPFTGEFDIPLWDETLGEYDPETGEWHDEYHEWNERKKEKNMVEQTVTTANPRVPVNLQGIEFTSNDNAPTNDPVNHPSHYTSGKIEVIDFIEDQKLDFHLANALKYICRAGKKNPDKTKEDLEKAVWYIQRYISHVLP